MANQQTTTTANVVVQSSGIGKLKSQWADFTGSLLEPIAILASGGSKVQALWAGVRSIFMAKVLGPLELGVGASLAFLVMTKRLVSAWKELGMSSAATLERMTLQFRPLLGSMERARDRVKELMEFTERTPFRLEETAEANKILEALTKGALSGREGMLLVGDAAAVAGVGLSEAARYTGRLYDGLMSGRPVGEAAMRLQEMGIITGQTRNQIESLQATNTSGLAIWRMVQAEMAKNKGAMDDMSVSLEGLQSTFEDTKMSLQAGFSENFMEGEKAGIKSSIALMKLIQPVAEEMGKAFGELSNWWANLKNKAVESATTIQGLGTTITWLVKGLLGFAGALALTGGVAMAGFIAKILLVAAGNKAAAQSQVMLNAVQGSSVGVMAKLTSMKNSALAAIRANAAGLRAEAAAHMQAAGAAGRNIVATNGVTAATRVASLSFKGMGMALRFVGAQFKLLAVSMLTNPLFLVIAALVAVGITLKHFSDQTAAAKKQQDDYAKSTDALMSKMTRESREIRTKIDLRRQEAAAIGELGKAYAALEGADDAKMKSLANERIDKLRKQLEGIRGKSGIVEKSENQYGRDAENRADSVAADRSGEDIFSERGPEQALAIAEKRLAVIEERRRAAIELEQLEAAAEKRADAAVVAGQENLLREQQIMREMAVLNEGLANHGKGWETAGETQDRHKKQRAKKAELEAELVGIRMNQQGGGAELSAQLNSGSEQMALNAKIAAYDQMMEAAKEVEDANVAVANAEKDGLAAAKESLDIALQRAAVANGVAGQAGVIGWGAGNRKEGVDKVSELETRRSEDISTDRKIKAAAETKKLAYDVMRARLDGEAAVDSIRLRGDEREAKLLEIEREKLELKKQSNLIGAQAYDRESESLNAKAEALKKESKEKREIMVQGMVLGKLQRAMAEAQLKGDAKGAKNLRDEIARREKAAEQAAAERDSREIGGKGNQEEYVKLRMAAFTEQQKMEEDARKRNEKESQRATRADVQSGVVGVQARVLKMQGNHDGAKAMLKEDQAKQDELARAARAKALRADGFSKGEASALARDEMKSKQGERILNKLFDQKGTVVAGSMAQIGGGGGVYGNDPQARALEKATRVLEQIRDNTVKTVEDAW